MHKFIPTLNFREEVEKNNAECFNDLISGFLGYINFGNTENMSPYSGHAEKRQKTKQIIIYNNDFSISIF